MPLSSEPSEPVRLMDVAGADYRSAFELFLSGTDEKALIHGHLADLVARLPHRRVLLDVGPGEGSTTQHLGQYFERTVVIEPSAHMRQALRRTCPNALVLAGTVDQVAPPVPVDLALCSHVLYFVEPSAWAGTVRRILEWVVPGGELVVILQNPHGDCMRMVRHFGGPLLDLAELGKQLVRQNADLVASTVLDTLEARYRTTSFTDAVTVAEFMLNNPAPADLPARDELAEYVRREFTEPTGGFAITCAHDVLRVRRAVLPD